MLQRYNSDTVKDGRALGQCWLEFRESRLVKRLETLNLLTHNVPEESHLRHRLNHKIERLEKKKRKVTEWLNALKGI